MHSGLFTSAYPIFSGLVFLSLMGIFLAPIANRVLHRLHMDGNDMETRKVRDE